MADGGSDSYRSSSSTPRPMSAVPNKCDCLRKRSKSQPVSKYCINDGVVCCTECAFDYHRECKVEQLESVVKTISRQDEEMLIKLLDTLQKSRQKLMEKLINENKQMVSKINEVYKQAKQALDTLEEDDLLEGEAKFTEYGNVCRSDITACVNAIDSLKTIKSSKNDTEHFIKYKQAQKLFNEIKGTRGNEILEYIAVDDIGKALRQTKLGSFLGESCIDIMIRGHVSIQIQAEGNCIRAISELPDGRLTVVSDILIQLDENYSLTFTTDLSDEMNDICYMGDHNIGVLLKTRRYEGLFQLIKVSSLKHSDSSNISVGFQKMTATSLGYIGRHLAFANERLYIQDRQSIFECNTSGKTVSTLFSKNQGEMVDFSAKRDGSRFYIACEEANRSKVIIVINGSGKPLFSIDDKDLNDMFSMCFDDDSRLFFACQKSKRILLFDEKGHKRGLVMDLEKQGEPLCVALHKKYNRLLVTIKGDDKILVYDM